MAFVGASIYKNGNVETFQFDEVGKTSFGIRKDGVSSAIIETTEINEVDFTSFGSKVSVKKDGSIVAFEFIEK